VDVLAYVKSRNFFFDRRPVPGIEHVVVATIPHATWVETHETWSMPGNPDATMRCAFALDGSYVGDVKDMRMLAKYGIVPERRSPELNVASIGFAPQSSKWYGWSHRALAGFDTRSKADDFAESVAAVQGLTYFETRADAQAHAERAERRSSMDKHPLKALHELLASADRDPVGAHVVTRKPTTLATITAAGEGETTANDDGAPEEKFDFEVMKHGLYAVAPLVRQVLRTIYRTSGTVSTLKIYEEDDACLLYLMMAVPQGRVLYLPGAGNQQLGKNLQRITAKIRKLRGFETAAVVLCVRPVNATRVMLGLQIDLD